MPVFTLRKKLYYLDNIYYENLLDKKNNLKDYKYIINIENEEVLTKLQTGFVESSLTLLQNNIDLISKSDRIIFPATPDTENLIMLAVKCNKSEIHCYNLDENILNIINNPNILSFGQSNETVTKETILLTDIYHSAKLLNFKYACLYSQAKESGGKAAVETEWKKLDAFTKHSNISTTNYHLIRKVITENTKHTDLELAEMEHIRWCRFHFLNHWTFGKTENGKKDSINKIHPCLIPFDELTEIDKQKDIDSIKVLNEALS